MQVTKRHSFWSLCLGNRFIHRLRSQQISRYATCRMPYKLIHSNIYLFIFKARFGFSILSDESLLAQVRASLNTEILPRHLASLEKIVAKSTTGWVAGTPEPTIADFILVPRLEWLIEPGTHDGISTDLLEPCPKIRALIAKMNALVAEMAADPEGFQAKRRALA
jgi:glutathione S-transferase